MTDPKLEPTSLLEVRDPHPGDYTDRGAGSTLGHTQARVHARGGVRIWPVSELGGAVYLWA